MHVLRGRGAGIGILIAAGVLYAASIRPAPRSLVVPVSGASPFDPSCIGQQVGSVTLNSAVEAFVAADPRRPGHYVGVWQQDRWDNGGSNGLLAAASSDGGFSWTTGWAHFSRCTGGTDDRASDAWVTIAPDGSIYQAALGVSGIGTKAPSNAVLVSRSTDGGQSWSDPVTLVRDSDGGTDKESITADPNNAQYVYAVWDKISATGAPALFSRTTDGGASWEPARTIFDPGVNAYTTGNEIVVLPGGAVVDVFAVSQNSRSYVYAMRSQDHGATWAPPVSVSTLQTTGTQDPKTRAGVRTGAGIPNAAADPSSGAIYAAWQDSRFSGGRLDGIALSKSTDGGLSWFEPVQVNQAPEAQAFTPVVAVAPDGRVAVTYFDFRNDTGDASVQLTNRWQVVSSDGGSTWQESHIGGTFNLLEAPRVSGGSLFLGDYQGLAASGDTFLSFFAAATGPSRVFAAKPVQRVSETGIR